jgi:hypothetical protein
MTNETSNPGGCMMLPGILCVRGLNQDFICQQGILHLSIGLFFSQMTMREMPFPMIRTRDIESIAWT